MTDNNDEALDTLVETDVVIDDTITETETPVYTFTITEKVQPNYGMTHSIIEWLQENMESLVDDHNKAIFGKVNTGFNDSNIKTFGKSPVCDVYIDRVEYETNLDSCIPIKVHTIIIFYMKGANNPTYLKATNLHDLIMQEFLVNDTFKLLDNVVRDTYITNSEIRNQAIRGGYGVMGTFELTHDLY